MIHFQFEHRQLQIILSKMHGISLLYTHLSDSIVLEWFSEYYFLLLIVDSLLEVDECIRSYVSTRPIFVPESHKSKVFSVNDLRIPFHPYLRQFLSAQEFVH